MNEQIKQLALAAGGSHYPDVGGRTLEKFAELLIQECCDIVEQDMKLAHIQMIPLTLEKYANSRLKQKIREHFGVES